MAAADLGSEDLLAYVGQVFQKLDEAVEQLKELPKKAEERTKNLLKLLNNEKTDIFGEDSAEFLEILNELNEEIGHASWEVLEIELRRQGVINPSKENPVPIPSSPKEVQPNQIIHVAQESQKGGGWTGYFSARTWAKMVEKYMKWKDDSLRVTPDIATAKEVLDILEFGRQLRPEMNATIDFHRQAIDLVYFFPDNDTRERCRSELRAHLTKICGIIRGFTQTSVDHRIENVGEQRRTIATSIISLVMAQYTAMGGITKRDLFRAVREAAGAQDAGA